GTNVVQHIILFRPTDPRELRPVKLDFRASDQLIEVKRGIESPQGQPVRFRNTVYVVCRYCAARSGHILRNDIRVPGNIFSDETRHVARPQIVTAACGGTDDEPDGLPLVVRSLSEQIRAPADQQRKKEHEGTLLCSGLKPRRSRWVLVTGFHLKFLKGSAILIRSGSVYLHPDKFFHLLHHVGRRGHHLFSQGFQLLTRGRVDIQPPLLRFRQKRGIIDRFVEGVANDFDSVGGNARRKNDGTTELVGSDHHFG